MYCTPAQTHVARKRHVCSSCGELIQPSTPYSRWRCYDSGDVGTVKMHLECLAAHQADAEGLGFWEFTPFSHERPAAL